MRRPLIGMFLVLLGCVAVSPAARTQDADPSKLIGFEPFIGTWAFNDDFLRDNEWAREFNAEVLEWGAKKNIVRLRETTHKTDRNRVIFEGFVYWHPVENRIRLAGYNIQERFFFEGEITELAADRAVREYRVHYPPGYAHTHYPQIKGDVRDFREERRLLDANTQTLTVSIRVDGKWEPWPTGDAKPFVTRRVE